MSFEDIKNKIVKTGKSLYDRGLAPGTCGNISIKTDKGILITCSGCCLGNLCESHIVLIDEEGNHSEGGTKASSEKFMHTETYKVRPDVSCIIHTHSPKATALSINGCSLEEPVLAETFVYIGGIPLIEYETPSTNKLAQSVAEGFKNHNAVLMANHGVCIVGKDLEETFYRLESLEFTADVFITAKLLGNYNLIPENKVKELMKIRNDKEFLAK